MPIVDFWSESTSGDSSHPKTTDPPEDFDIDPRILRAFAALALAVWILGGLAQIGKEATSPGRWFRSKPEGMVAVGRPTVGHAEADAVLKLVQRNGGFDAGYMIVFPTGEGTEGEVKTLFQMILQGYPNYPSVVQVMSGELVDAEVPGIILSPHTSHSTDGLVAIDEERGFVLYQKEENR